MPLATALQTRIVNLTNEHWSAHVHDRAFTDLTSGKEPGHRMADYVDDRTTSLLKIHLDTRFEGNRNGTPKLRSMGDVWVHSERMFNPINIKSGLQDMNGQPNLVSMQKLLDYILNRRIDSYYLLIIKFSLTPPLSHKTFLIDVLDWIDFITYDAGPGQIMLRERDFYEAHEAGYDVPDRSLPAKAEILFDLFERKLEDLFANRRTRLHRQKTLLQSFRNTDFTVDQSAMSFVT